MDEEAFELGPLGDGWLPYIITQEEIDKAKRLMIDEGLSEQGAFRQVISSADYQLIYGIDNLSS